MISTCCRQQGVALITALLIVSIVSVIATSMISRKNLEIRRQASVTYWYQAYQYALGVESWGVKVLKEDLQQDENRDHWGEDWATVLPPMEVEGGQVSGEIKDLQGRFNLNSLPFREKDMQKIRSDLKFQQFQRLLESAGIDGEVAFAVLDWMDSDAGSESLGPLGAEDDYYLGLDIPYRAPNMEVVSVSELLLVRGIEFDDFMSLQDHISALPEEINKVNVNTSSDKVLKSLDEGLVDADVEKMYERQEGGGFDNIDIFVSDYFPGSSIDDPDEISNFKKTVTLSSSYFMIESDITIGHVNLHFSSLISRSGNEVKVVRRSFGAL